MQFQRLALFGVGLIGGSLARALKRASVCGEIVGVGRVHADLRRAVELGFIDRDETDVGRAVEGADLVVVATPIGAMRGVFERISGHLAIGAVVTDVGSAKMSVIDDARAAFGDAFPRFVPGHPIAGTEKSGVEAGFADLYRGQRVILTPTEWTDAAAVERVRQMWEITGAVVETMTAERHDEILAYTSHLPHMVAYALVDVLAGLDGGGQMLHFAAGGFRDLTRIASSSPRMWRDIALANREALLAAIDSYGARFGALRAALDRADGGELEAIFIRAKAARDRLGPAGRESPEA
jgi:prephenate dehydrogenase